VPSSPLSAARGVISQVADLIPGRHKSDHDDLVPELVFKDTAATARQAPARKEADAIRGKMLTIVSLQRADGSWELNEEFARAVGQPLDKLRLAQADATGEAGEINRAWATAVALHWLKAHASALASEWRMIATKARDWLDRVSARPASGQSWNDEAARLS